jgi:hypothetical protein
MCLTEVGVLSCVVDHILQEFNTLFLTRFRTCKTATPPQTKMTSNLVIGVFKVPSSMDKSLLSNWSTYFVQREGEPLPDLPAKVPNTAPPREEGAGGGGGAARGGAAADPLASSYV